MKVRRCRGWGDDFSSQVKAAFNTSCPGPKFFSVYHGPFNPYKFTLPRLKQKLRPCLLTHFLITTSSSSSSFSSFSSSSSFSPSSSSFSFLLFLLLLLLLTTGGWF